MKDLLNVFENNTGFVFADNKLQEVKWLRTDFKYDHSEGESDVYTARTTYQKPDGTTDVLTNYNRAFDSVKGYEEGEVAATNATSFNKANCGIVVSDLIHGYKTHRNKEYWVFDRTCHTPARYELELDRFYFDYADRRFHTDEFPKDCKIYDTKEEALSWNTYNVALQDGTESQRDGANKLVSLDDDQLELVRQFEALCQKMRDSDIILIGDSDRLSAFNMRKVHAFTLDYERPSHVDFGEPEDYEQVERFADAFHVDWNGDIWGEDNDLYILRKSSEDEEK